MTVFENIAEKPPFDLQVEQKGKNYSLVEYLRKEAKSTEKHEYINGKIVKMPYAKGPHNIIIVNVINALSNALDLLEKNYIVFPSDQKIYFPKLNEGSYADALAVAETPEYWDSEELLLINPFLVVEVLSKSTAKYDRTGKFDKYKTLDSFREYIMIRQDECYAEVWYKEKPGLWHETIVTDLDKEISLQSVEAKLSMQKIYKNVKLK